MTASHISHTYAGPRQDPPLSGHTVLTQAESAYESIRAEIVTLRMRPGSPIHEERLMRELGFGRTPIREAVKRLALEDMVEIYPRRGTFVSDINITDLADISDVRVQIEGHAAARAAERASADDRLEARALIGDLGTLADLQHREQAGLMEADVRVHRFIYSCCKNTYLATTAERFLFLSLRIWYLALDRLPHLDERVLEHAGLLQAILDGDPARARELARHHVVTFEREIRLAL